MPELPRQSDGLPLFDLIAAVEDARRELDEIEAQRLRPLWRIHAAARGELAAEILRGLLAGDPITDWRRPLQTLGIDLPADPSTEGLPFLTGEAIGRELAHWLTFVAAKR